MTSRGACLCSSWLLEVSRLLLLLGAGLSALGSSVWSEWRGRSVVASRVGLAGLCVALARRRALLGASWGHVVALGQLPEGLVCLHALGALCVDVGLLCEGCLPFFLVCKGSLAVGFPSFAVQAKGFSLLVQLLCCSARLTEGHLQAFHQLLCLLSGDKHVLQCSGRELFAGIVCGVDNRVTGPDVILGVGLFVCCGFCGFLVAAMELLLVRG